MRNYHWVRVVVSLVLMMWIIPLPAQGQTPVLGVHYVFTDCPSAKGEQCARLINQRGDPVDAQSFAKLFGLDAFKLRNLNLTSTIAVCRDPIRRDVWHMAKIERVQDRASNIVWANCPESDRKVVTIPGEFYKTGLAADSTMITLGFAEKAARQCGAKPDCIRNTYLTYFPEDGTSPPTISNGDSASSTTTPPSAPIQPLTVSPQNPASMIQPSQVQNQDVGAWTKSDYVILSMSISIGVLFIIIGYLWWTKRRSRERLEYIQSLKNEAESELIGAHNDEVRRVNEVNQRLSKENGGLSARIIVLEAGVKSLEGQITEHDQLQRQALSNKETTYQRIMQERAEENGSLTSRLNQALRVLSQLAERYTPTFKGDVVTADSLIKGIESGVVREIITSLQQTYGLEVMQRFTHPLSREEAWNLPLQAQREWHQAFIGHMSVIHRIVKSESALLSHVSEFEELNALRADLLLFMQTLRDDLPAIGFEGCLSENPDLFTLLERYVVAFADAKRGYAEELASETRKTEEWKKACARLRQLNSADSDQAPISRPADTMPGLPLPASEVPSSSLVGGRIRLVVKSGQ